MKTKYFSYGMIFFLAVGMTAGCGTHPAQRRQARLEPMVQKSLRFILEHDGLKRVYFVHRPVNLDPAKPVPVVIHFHGGGGSAAQAETSTQMNRTADREGFMAVYPEGTGREIKGKHFGTWNAGTCCGAAAEKNIDDVGFISKMIDQLAHNFSIDRSRVYAAGISNGGAMAYRLACELEDKIAAIAPVSYNGETVECRPSRPVPIIHFHGLQDPCAVFEGGMCGGCFEQVMKTGSQKSSLETCPAVRDTLANWIRRNQLPDSQAVIFQKDGAVCRSFGPGEAGEIVLCTDENLGHRWPGGAPTGMCSRGLNTPACRRNIKIQGPFSNTLEANQLMWEFFRKQSLKR